MGPLLERGPFDRHDIGVRHEERGLKIRIRSLPSEEQRIRIHPFEVEVRMRQGIEIPQVVS